MSHEIDPKAKFLLMSYKTVEIPGNFTDIFVQYSSRIKEINCQNNQYKIQAISSE
jgi:hypothetical protein